MDNGNRVIFNTGIQYVKMMITMVVSLLSARWVLESLGKEDYGLFSLVGGIIAMFAFLNSALASATQRFLSFEIGKNDKQSIKEVFYNSIVVHFFAGIVIAALFQIGGTILIDNYLDIPLGKEYLAHFVLNTMSISSFFVIISVPYQAVMNAHENLFVISILDILQAILKLLVAWYLLSYQGNGLQLYAVAVMVISILNLSISRIYCKKSYGETRFVWHKIEDYSYFKKLGSYLGWLSFGFVCAMGRTQGLTIVLNMFFGVIINAAYGIADQINSQVLFFSSSILRAIRPQIIQSEGQGNSSRMIRLSFTACKFSFICLSFVVVPLIFNIETVLSVWLNDVPEYTASFVKIILCMSLINQLTAGTFIANESKGNIRSYQIATGCFDLLVIPIGYIVLKYTNVPYSILLVALAAMTINLFICVYITNRNLNLPRTLYVDNVLLRIVVAVIPGVALSFILESFSYNLFIKIVIQTLAYIIVVAFCFYKFGMSTEEQTIIDRLWGKITR